MDTIPEVKVMKAAAEPDRPSQRGPRPKLLIVSSYRRPCGIAQYVEFLELPLRVQTEFDVDIAALPVDLFRSGGPYARRAANQIFDEILSRVRKADVVSIQFELGLFGLTPFAIWRRLKAVLSASKKVIITYHTAPAASRPLRLRLSELKDVLRSSRIDYVFRNLFRYARRRPGKIRHLVQTKREAVSLSLMGLDADTIFAEPLSFLQEETRRELADPKIRERLDQRYNLAGKTVIGCFGFLADYKGTEVAIDAMEHLPDDYHLMIVGGLHPEGIVHHTTSQPFITKLMAKIEDDETLVHRVHFCGALSNDDFNMVMAGCDAVVLPYAEVGQTSSGPAALALDLQKPLYCSRTHCFKELDKFGPGAITFFEIGNHLELAEKLMREEAKDPHRVEARRSYVDAHNVEIRSQVYTAAARQLLGRA